MNGDMSMRVVIDTTRMEWTPSPSGAVDRKRLHLVGESESGQVTSIVRYPPKSTFPEHDHPEGEEIFVLEGVFSDQQGDAAAGTHMLNPEGFRHRPGSEPGCILFVKLRQYADASAKKRRPYCRTETNDMPWTPSEFPGIDRQLLFQEAGFPDITCLERWSGGAAPGERHFAGGIELFVIEGALSDSMGRYAAGTWMRLPDGLPLDAHSDGGCVLYLKSGTLPTLRESKERSDLRDNC